MTDAIVVDSYAWVEYAAGTPEGNRAQKYIEGNYPLFTPVIVVAELSDRATRTNRRDAWRSGLYPFIRRHTEIVQLTGELADNAGPLKWEMRDGSHDVGLADAIVLATARDNDARVLTGDADFLHPTYSDEVIDITTS